MLCATQLLSYIRNNQILEAIAMLEQDILDTAIKQSGGNSLLKRKNAAIRYLKAIGENRPALRIAIDAIYQGEPVQALCNGFTGMFLYDSIPGLPTAESTGLKEKPFDLAKVLLPVPADYERIDIDVPAIRAKYAIWKSATLTKERRRNRCSIEIGDKQLDAEQLLPVVDILGESDLVCWYQPNHRMEMIYLCNPNGIAIVLPLRQ